MKPETAIRKVKEDDTILPLMKTIWLEKRELGFHKEETLQQCRNKLAAKTDEEIMSLFYSLAYPNYTELGVPNDSCILYEEHCLIPLLESDEVKAAVLKAVRGK